MMSLPETLMSSGVAAFQRGLVSFLSSMTLWCGAAVAEPIFAASSTPLVGSPTEPAGVLATVSVAAEMDRLETANGFYRVTLEGWARDGVHRVLFRLPGKRILVASLDKDKVELLEMLETTVDPETGITWNRMRIYGWIAQDAAVQAIEPIWQSAWELFAERCTACHQRRVPEHYTANQWRSLIKVMGPRTGLPEAEQKLILAFLQNHASDTVGPVSGPQAATDRDVRR